MKWGDVEGDERLLERCRSGDQQAWRTVVERHAGLVNGILRGAFRLSAADAEDAFQEVFCRLYVRLGTVRDERALTSWVAQVTRNVALDWLRRAANREEPSGDTIDDAAYDEPVLEVLEAMEVRAALERLAEHHREILDRFFLRDESYVTISEELAIPPGTVASRISRALDALRGEVVGREGVPAASTL